MPTVQPSSRAPGHLFERGRRIARMVARESHRFHAATLEPAAHDRSHHPGGTKARYARGLCSARTAQDEQVHGVPGNQDRAAGRQFSLRLTWPERTARLAYPAIRRPQVSANGSSVHLNQTARRDFSRLGTLLIDSQGWCLLASCSCLHPSKRHSGRKGPACRSPPGAAVRRPSQPLRP